MATNNAINAPLPFSIGNGGTNTNSQTSNGVNYYDGTKITSSGIVTWNGTNTLSVSTSSASIVSLQIINTNTDSGLLLRRGTTSNQAGVTHSTVGTANWFTGVSPISGGSEYAIINLQSSSNVLSVDPSTNNITIYTLSASQLVGSNSNKELSSVNLSGDITTSGSLATTLATVNSNVGTFGDATHVGSFTVNAKGLITAASSITITGVSPGGSAGGDLTGTYPNPTIAANAVTNAKFRQSAALSIVGNSTNATANVADIAAASDNQVMRRSGTAIAFGSIDLSQSNTVGATILGVANGGSGTSTAFTAGSFVFAGASGVYSQDNANLFWDNTNKKAYIGANTSNSLTMPGILNTRGTDGTTNNAINFYTTSDAFAGMSLFHDTHGNQAINFDAYWNGSNNVSSYVGSNYQIVHLSNQLQFNYGSGVVAGAALTWAIGMFLNTSGDLTLNGNLIVNTASKSLQVKSAAVSAGTANASLVTGVVLSSGASGTINNSTVTTSHVGFANCTSASGTITFVRVTCGSGSFTVTGGSLDNSTYSVLFVKAI